MNTIPTIFKETHDRMAKGIAHAAHEFSTLHTGKANPAMLDTVQVAVTLYGGAISHIRDIAAISTPDHRSIVIQPWDKGVIQDINRAIIKANIGFNPVIDGNLIRINVPELSGDRRREMIKVASTLAEEARVRVRAVRRDMMEAIKALQKASSITEDEAKRAEKDLQTETDKAIAEVNKLLAAKEKELMTV